MQKVQFDLCSLVFYFVLLSIAIKNGKSLEDQAVEIVTRAQWNALPSTSSVKMETPVGEVFYSETDTRTCLGKEECIKIVQGIQKYNMEIQGKSDIHYHFLIGGDGRIYEGRGWLDAGPRLPKNGRIPSHLEGKCLDVAFIGCYKDREPTEVMIKAAEALIEFGLENNFLVVDEADLEKEEDLENKENTESDKMSTDGTTNLNTDTKQ